MFERRRIRAIVAVAMTILGLVAPSSVAAECTQLDRWPSFRGMDVPEILTSGDHGAVARWRAEQATARTRERRPDLLPLDDGG